MVAAVGTPAAIVRSTTSPVTGSWGTGQNRTAGNLLVAVVTAAAATSAGTTAQNTGTTGWTQLLEIGSSALPCHSVVAIWTKTAAGADAAPAFTSTLSGTGAMTCTLVELNDAGGTPVAGTTGTYSSGATASTVTYSVSTAGNVAAASSYVLAGFCEERSSAISVTYTCTGTGFTALTGDSGQTVRQHNAIDANSSPAAGSPDTNSGHWSTSSANAYGAAVIAEFAAPAATVTSSAALSGTGTLGGAPYFDTAAAMSGAGTLGGIPQPTVPYVVGQLSANTSTTSFTVPVTQPMAPGDGLAVGSSEPGNGVISAVSDNQGNIWSLAGQVVSNPAISVWEVTGTPTPLGAGDQINITFSVLDSVYKEFLAVGVPGQAVPDTAGNTTGSANTASPSLASGTLAGSGEYVLTWLSNGSVGGPPSWNAPAAQAGTTLHGGTGSYLSCAWQLASSTAAVTSGATLSASAGNRMAATPFSPPAAPVSGAAAMSGQGSLGGSPYFQPAAAMSGQGSLAAAPARTAAGAMSGSGTLRGAGGPFWMTASSFITTLDGIDHASTLTLFGGPGNFSVGNSASAPGSLPGGYATTPVCKYIAYGQLLADITGTSQTISGVTYTPVAGGISASYQWLMYDNEDWSPNPPSPYASAAAQAEIDDPWTYMGNFTTLAHAHGYKVILAPARDLGNDPTSVNPVIGAETLDAWYVRTSIAGTAAATGAEIVHIQAQADQASSQYATFFGQAATQVRAAAGGMFTIISAGVSTTSPSGVTAAQMLAAYQSVAGISEGLWLNMSTATASTADTFMLGMLGGAPSSAALSGQGTLGGLPVLPGTAALSGQGTLAASPQLRATAALSGLGTLLAAGTLPGPAALSGLGTLTTAPVFQAAGGMSGLGTLAAAPVRPAAIAMSGLGTLGSAPTLAAAGALSGLGTLGAAPVRPGSAVLSGLGTLGTVPVLSGSQALSGLGTLAGHVTISELAVMSGLGTLAGIPGGGTGGSAALTGLGTLSAAGYLASPAALAGLGTLAGGVQLAGTAALSGLGSLTGLPAMRAAAAMAGLGSLAAVPGLAAAASLTGTGTLTAVISIRPVVLLSGQGTLAGGYLFSFQGAAVLSGLGTLGGSWALVSPGDTGTVPWIAAPAASRWAVVPALPRWLALLLGPRWSAAVHVPRWTAAPALPRWEIIMTAFAPISALSLEEINIVWTSDLDGTTIVPTALAVQFAVPVSSGILSAPAQPVTWYPASWLAGGTGKGFIAQGLVGPGAGTAILAAGSKYDVWGKILGSPEQPVKFAGVQAVY